MKRTDTRPWEVFTRGDRVVLEVGEFGDENFMRLNMHPSVARALCRKLLVEAARVEQRGGES